MHIIKSDIKLQLHLKYSNKTTIAYKRQLQELPHTLTDTHNLQKRFNSNGVVAERAYNDRLYLKRENLLWSLDIKY